MLATKIMHSSEHEDVGFIGSCVDLMGGGYSNTPFQETALWPKSLGLLFKDR